MKKVVVFGGSGFLGSYVADELTRRGYEVLVADVKDSPYLTKGQSFLSCDITDSVAVAKAVEGTAYVYNFAGLADIDESIDLPRKTMEQNVVGNVNVLEACRNAEIERFVYASSAYAFSNKGSFYGISKLASEKIVEEYKARFGMPFTIIRYGSLYGERADHHNGVYRLLREAIETRAIRHPGDGEEYREYIHASDAARLSVDIIEDAQFVDQHLILTGVERLRKKDLFRMIQEILNDEISVTFSGKSIEGHYQVTPYSYHPNVARKLVSNTFIDLGQGLVSCVKQIGEELEKSRS